jgi:hypothetical protein
VTLKIRVLGSHLPRRGLPLAAWAYHAEVYDDSDSARPLWTCAHDHESPQLAHGCAANWIEAAEGGDLSLSEQAAG